MFLYVSFLIKNNELPNNYLFAHENTPNIDIFAFESTKATKNNIIWIDIELVFDYFLSSKDPFIIHIKGISKRAIDVSSNSE